MTMKTISMKKFFHYFCKDACNKQFCFILGAGASMQSGIPGARKLAQRWIEEIKNSDKEDYTQWVQTSNIDTLKPEIFYSHIFDKRFELDIQIGHNYLRSIMEQKEPSCGYSILAQILATTKSNVVITTNFDNLIEDAMFIYSSKRPVVIGHEYLSEFIHASSTHPLIIKVHRDLNLAPKNSIRDTLHLNEGIKKQLSHIIRNYTPIVIGYGANDGSLIGFLNELTSEDINGGIFWSTLSLDDLNNATRNVIQKFNGFAVIIDGFDEFMIQLGNELHFPRLDEIIMDTAKKRAENYRNQVSSIKNKLNPSSTINKAITNIISRSKTDWWTYETDAISATSIQEKEKIYQKGLIETNNCSELLLNYAVFLKNIRKDYGKAEWFYKKALDLYPKNSDVLGNYAIFLYAVQRNADLADTYYKKALEENPSNSQVVGNYALFLDEVRKDSYNADRYYQKAIELEPTNSIILSNYAVFLYEIKKDFDKANIYYQKVLELNPSNLPNLGNYAKLLIETGKLKEAKMYLDLAFKENEEHPNEPLELEISFYAIAVFPDQYPNAEKRIEELLIKGIQSVGWNLQPILEIAKTNQHPKYSILEDYARRITEHK